VDTPVLSKVAVGSLARVAQRLNNVKSFYVGIVVSTKRALRPYRLGKKQVMKDPAPLYPASIDFTATDARGRKATSRRCVALHAWPMPSAMQPCANCVVGLISGTAPTPAYSVSGGIRMLLHTSALH